MAIDSRSMTVIIRGSMEQEVDLLFKDLRVLFASIRACSIGRGSLRVMTLTNDESKSG
jgi:hypothetical protein